MPEGPPSFLARHLEYDFQLDWCTERKACDTIYEAARVLLFSENVLQHLRSTVRDFRLVANISRSGHHHAQPDDPCHFVERSQMLPRNSESVQRRSVSRFAACFYVELSADTPDEFRVAAFRRKHPS